ncbi:tripartite tricarboxylate transporter substrate binding protein [Verticiella sediminum]|uniref:Tripartite tricarboxylate transporter substrate binding protein n=1 Tax=Verticiella sediminum TaxID=1247510 RepID=A0A556AMT8_9BURK|nr:tripartite tricarboxylate transporter substrate binding protein [Verticiella sediminum]TSH94200.1 tripartite tricarboxylate transporter substrate binding protein [Verticiella sediminum]
MNDIQRRRQRRAVCMGMLALGLAASLPQAHAAGTDYPERPLSIIVPNPPGSATDTLARMVAEALNRAWGQPVVVENKPGAQGVIGVQTMKRAPADGYTLIISFSGLNSSNPWLQAQPAYHYKDDFTHIAPLVRAPSLLLVNVDSPYHSVDDLLHDTVSGNRHLTYGYGQATSQVMGSAYVHAADIAGAVGIPYRGQPQALTDLVGRQFDFMFADLSVAKPFVDAGKLRALAVSTGERVTLAPDVPTLDELGVRGYDLAAWVGLSGPAGMPPAIVTKISEVVRAAFRAEDVQARIRQLGFTSLDADPATFAAFVDSEYEKWGRAIKAAGIEPQ